VKTIRAYFSLVRVHNGLMASLGVAVGQYLSSSSGHLPLNPYGMAAAFFVCGFGNILNDILDVETDRINHPQRALPSGRITLGQAKALALLFFLVSIALLIPLNGPGRIIVVLAVLLLVWYNFGLKHTAYTGNIAVSLLGGLTFMLGGTVVGIDRALALPGPVIPVVFAFLMHFGREIIKDISDLTGDTVTGSRTAPVTSGAMPPLLIAHSLFLLLIILSIGAYLEAWFNAVYFIITLLLVIVPLIWQLIWLGIKPDRKKCRLAAVLIKLQMLPGIIALILGKNY
jgi:geranylgeranylglycerol-phosphate geranylgeranyltransferase